MDHLDYGVVDGRVMGLLGSHDARNVVASASPSELSALVYETDSAHRILYRRAVRLRRLTGNPNLKTQAEIEAEHMTMREVAMMTLVRPFYLGFREPIVAFWNLYLGMIYGTLVDCRQLSIC